MNSFELIGHVTMGLFAIGMLLFLLMIFKGVKKVKKRGRKAGKRLKRYNNWLKKLNK
jgi:4-hydroxybenzoate polyprenyltransferase